VDLAEGVPTRFVTMYSLTLSALSMLLLQL